MKPYTYLLVDLLSVAIPIAYSFEKKLQFYRHYYAWIPALLISSLLFIIWDILFTHWGIWGFNARYLIGIQSFRLPLEEWLFFITIPYACIFTYEVLNYSFENNALDPYTVWLTTFLVVLLSIISLLHLHQFYTLSACSLTAIFLAYEQWYHRAAYLGRMYRAYLVLIIPFLLVNGILTGTWLTDGVVVYNDQHNLGMRLGAIPYEDFFYGLLLIGLNISLYEAFKKKPIRN